jgi:2,3-bisphosphoglycerate-dependent phosphoglycerate mutase
MTFEVLLVRHGESVRNLSCDYARQGDSELLARQMVEETEESLWPLTEKGIEQANTSGAWIRARYGSDFQTAISSPFIRARDTAEHLGLGLDWRTDERIREREWGDYCAEGLEPYTVDAYLQDLAMCSAFHWRSPFPGGESLADVVPRVRPFVMELIAAAQDGDRAIVVSHGGTMRAMQLVFERLAPEEHTKLLNYRMSNGCVILYRLEVDDKDRKLWTGESKQAHPAFPAIPETDWKPFPL